MDSFLDWLLEWSPVLSLIAMIAITWYLLQIDNRLRREGKRIRGLNEIVDCTIDAIRLVDGYNREPDAQAIIIWPEAVILGGKLGHFAFNIKLYPELATLLDTTLTEYQKFLASVKSVANGEQKGMMCLELTGVLFRLQRTAADLKLKS